MTTATAVHGTVRIGQWVRNRAAFGLGEPTWNRIDGLCLTRDSRSKHGHEVEAVSTADIVANRVIFTFGDRWCYSEQVEIGIGARDYDPTAPTDSIYKLTTLIRQADGHGWTPATTAYYRQAHTAADAAIDSLVQDGWTLSAYAGRSRSEAKAHLVYLIENEDSTRLIYGCHPDSDRPEAAVSVDRHPLSD